jgi:hypothetical protein
MGGGQTIANGTRAARRHLASAEIADIEGLRHPVVGARSLNLDTADKHLGHRKSQIDRRLRRLRGGLVAAHDAIQLSLQKLSIWAWRLRCLHYHGSSPSSHAHDAVLRHF